MCVCVYNYECGYKVTSRGHIEQYFSRVCLNMDLEVNMQIKGGNQLPHKLIHYNTSNFLFKFHRAPS